MLNIGDDTKTAFLTDSTPKELSISVSSEAQYKNRYKGGQALHRIDTDFVPGWSHGIYPYDDQEQKLTSSDWATSGYNLLDFTNIHDFEYLCVSFVLDIDLIDPSQPYPSTVKVQFIIGDNYSSITRELILNTDEHLNDFDSESERIMFYVPTVSLPQEITLFLLTVSVPSTESVTLNGSMFYTRTIIHVGNDPTSFPYPYKKYSESDVDIDDEYSITNDHLLSESFSLNESLCSEENIKFGLCESAYCQFTVTDDYHDFRDKEIKPKISVKLSDETADRALAQINLYKGLHPMPGFDTVKDDIWNNFSFTSYGRIADIDYIKVSDDAISYFDRYNFLRITIAIKLEFDNYTVLPDKVLFTTDTTLNVSTGGTQAWRTRWYNDAAFTAQQNFVADVSDITNDYVIATFDVPIDYVAYYKSFGDQYVTSMENLHLTTLNNLRGLYIEFLDSSGNYYSSSPATFRLIVHSKFVQINYIQEKTDSVPIYDPYDCAEYRGMTISEYIAQFGDYIPLGVFTVQSIKKNYVNDILKQEITAYDKLTLLEQNAADWYTQYIFGIDSDTWDGMSKPGFEFARQNFSTYFNYALSVGLERKDYYTETVIDHHYYSRMDNVPSSSFIQLKSWPASSSSSLTAGNIKYLKYTISSVNPTKLYVVNISYLKSISSLMDEIAETNYFDSLGRGLVTGNVLVKEEDSSSAFGYCVDSGDYFMVSPSCTELTIYVAVKFQYLPQEVAYLTGTYDVSIDICEVDSAPDLVNGSNRLLYYGYKTREIFACDSSITGRDVVRSLLEVNGCFYRLNRYTGKPAFIYCNKSGLYPRDDLYPADDLYPRLGSNQTINMSQYQSFIQEDYEVQRYGRIQILKNITSNKTKSVVEWEYIGDEDFKNSYLIEDNIFYCNDKMEYDYDGMPEVSSMLENMWLRISNMNYVPCVLKCMGMPWIECGDRVGTLTKTGGAETFVFHRTLTGIQSLIDTFESEGDEYNKEVKDYGYKEWEG